MMESSARKTRLAPSPTGALHLGNARTFLINWALARQNGWRIVLRIEDLDGPRVKLGADTQAIEDLTWLGLDWDEGPYYQRADLSPYDAALDELREKQVLYPCTCSRREIEEAQSAPHGAEHDLRYPGTCRPKDGQPSSRPLATAELNALRVFAPLQPVTFVDEIHGPQSVDVNAQVGDFVVATKTGLPAYQLAVVVDDARQGVTDIVRGDDLIGSAGRQLWLYHLLGLTALPRYWHLPLVLGADGRRLAKRHGDTRVASLRQQGVPVARIIGLLAGWSGIEAQREPMSATEFASRFSSHRLPLAPAVFTEDDYRWLLAR